MFQSSQLSLSNDHDGLIQIGEGKRCYGFNPNTALSFINWHSGTSWAHQQNQITNSAKVVIRWGASRQAVGWGHFDEAADRFTGEPKLVCQRCDKVIKHPAINGTTGMDTHLKSKGCMGASKRRGLTQLDLTEGFRAGVLPQTLP